MLEIFLISNITNKMLDIISALRESKVEHCVVPWLTSSIRRKDTKTNEKENLLTFLYSIIFFLVCSFPRGILSNEPFSCHFYAHHAQLKRSLRPSEYDSSNHSFVFTQNYVQVHHFEQEKISDRFYSNEIVHLRGEKKRLSTRNVS